MAVLTYVIRYTKPGRMCRATQQDRKMASILGINTDRGISTCSVIGAAMPPWRGADHHELRHLSDFYVGFITAWGVHREGARRHRLAAGRCSEAWCWSGRGAVLGDGQHRPQGRSSPSRCWYWIPIFRPQGLLGRPQIAKAGGDDDEQRDSHRSQAVSSMPCSPLTPWWCSAPIVGVVPDGCGFNLHYEGVGWIIAIVMAGRFLLSLYLRPAAGAPCWGASRGLAAASTSCRRAG